MRPYVVVDIDGTIARNGARLSYILGAPKDWDSFYLSCEEDEPDEIVINLVKSIYEKYTVVFCTGRSEICREHTTRWIRKHVVECRPLLLMRKHGDHRPDTEVKPELLKGVGITTQNTAFILEDRQSVVDKWRALGFKCLQVQEGDF